MDDIIYFVAKFALEWVTCLDSAYQPILKQQFLYKYIHPGKIQLSLSLLLVDGLGEKLKSGVFEVTRLLT